MPASRSRHGSEDWVVQTRELHIDSPLVAQGARLGGVEEVAAVPSAEGVSGQIADVTMYDEDIPMTCSPPRPRLGIDAHSEPTMPPSHSTLQSEGRPSTFTTPPDVPMTASQPHQPAVRKQKFTMGPRADCEKCRLGVKGHWMHLD
ncbi:hypothetical protein DAEQUDRAFT_721010 [Daedalea quercina L-15889]|uniref:Uncharacterized protein n=1 Tax=Daedalea quercina L-15889 TaxID=1314783 RepID=A0A165TYB0_9APHY|nr:hypothetical protein DAEQUDRAFT_721010 [Daedalea quercina L-15889]